MIAKVYWEGLEDDETFMRTITFPEEERRALTTVPWSGGFRWFRSLNIICLDRYRNPLEMARICDRILNLK